MKPASKTKLHPQDHFTRVQRRKLVRDSLKIAKKLEARGFNKLRPRVDMKFRSIELGTLERTKPPMYRIFLHTGKFEKIAG